MKVKLNFLGLENSVSTDITLETTTQNKVELIPIGKSGIHIKKKNRGSFTSYCGGKVTDECIRRAKNSPSAAIRKKAVFAQNARGWARKHQFGGTLSHTPGIPSTGVASAFIDLEEVPPTYAQNHPEEFILSNPSTRYEPDITQYPESSGIKDVVTETPSDTKSVGLPAWLTTPYHGVSQQAVPEGNTNYGTFGTGASDALKASVNKFLGVPYEVRDCSRFVSAVLKDMGYKQSGNSRDLWNATQRVNKEDLRPGDLVFLQNTQLNKGIRSGLASHVAIVTDTSRLADGIIGIAHSSGRGKKSNMTTWNLNTMKNYLGAGRLT